MIQERLTNVANQLRDKPYRKQEIYYFLKISSYAHGKIYLEYFWLNLSLL